MNSLRMEFKRILLVVCVTVGLAFLAPADASECPPRGHVYATAPVELDIAVPQPVVHNTRSRSEITRLAGNDSMVGVHNAGLTRSRTEFRIQPRFQLATFGDGRACVMLERLTASWKIIELTVDVAREYAPGTCQYREVLAHEDEHVRINRYTLSQFAPMLEARLRRAAAAMTPRWDRKGSREAMESMTRELKAAGAEVLAEFQAELKKRHGAIDTPESYREVARKCDRW